MASVPSPENAPVYVCVGKKCVRACEHDQLVRALCKVGPVQAVRCQKICHGSVVGAVLDGRLEWYERIDSPRLCIGLKQAVRRRSRRNIMAKLKKHRVKGYRDRPPR